MKVDVWDTYVRKKDGELMHFDIIVPSGTSKEEVISFGNEYLKSKEVEGEVMAKMCNFCHSESGAEKWVKSIKEKGYFIYEMEGC
ncbi:DUF2024 family protein [Candidatus Pacearchaeota archaeon]|nr:MAG: DUF2024 family protein [Candidatus Pacearchaeota archaeon]